MSLLHHWVRFICVLLAVIIVAPAYSAPHFKQTDGIREAYDLMRRLELDSAAWHLAKLRLHEPENMLIPYYEDYIDIIRIVILEDEEQFKTFQSRKDARLAMVGQGDANSPWYLLTEAEIHLHWALARMKFEEFFTAAVELNKAFRLLKRNARKHPEFPYTYRSLGLLKAAFGTIPDKYQWLISLISSLEGSVEEGLEDMQRAYLAGLQDGDRILVYESGMMYTFGLLNFSRSGNTGKGVVRDMQLDPAGSAFDCFFKAYVHMKIGENEKVIELLSRKPESPTAIPFHYMDLMLGMAKLYRGDADADKPILRFVQQFKGRNYIKEAYQKLAWHALLYEGEDKYYQYLRVCRLKGAAVTDADKHAQKEAEAMDAPLPCLLRARIFFDGGYHNAALRAMHNACSCDMADPCHLEKLYRRGRIAHAMDKPGMAIESYRQTIAQGSNSALYYACSAALHAGELMEKMGKYDEAREFYRTCLSFKPDDYQSGLHQKAKAGLQRVR